MQRVDRAHLDLPNHPPTHTNRAQHGAYTPLQSIHAPLSTYTYTHQAVHVPAMNSSRRCRRASSWRLRASFL